MGGARGRGVGGAYLPNEVPGEGGEADTQQDREKDSPLRDKGALP